MNGFEDLLGRLTHRLRVDPELQMEVAHELRAHLEDAVAECRAAGMTEEQALSTAVKAMGNEAEIAEQLWQANRQRVRVRKVVQWAAGATLMPAAIAVSVTVAWGAIVSVALLLPMVAGLWGDYGRGSVANRIADRFRQDALATLSPESRFIVETPREDVEASLAEAQALAERYPDDPVYCAHYAAQLLGRAGLGASRSRPWRCWSAASRSNRTTPSTR